METERPVPDTEGKKTDLMGRAAEIFQEFGGPRWSEIAKELEGEGYLEDGKPLTSNALRKRFQKNPVLRRLLEDSRQGKLQPKDISVLAVPKEVLENQSPQSLGRVKRDITKDHTKDTTVTAKEVLALLQSSMQRRDEILIEQIRKSTTGSDMGVLLQIEDRMVTKMNEEWKRIEDELEQVEARLEMLVEHRVEENLQSLVTPGGSFAKDLENIIDQILDRKLSGQAETLFSALTLAPGQPGGPGRWEGEGKMARFSATMPQRLYDRMKAIEGDASFSARIAAACDVYLRALAARESNTEYENEG